LSDAGGNSRKEIREAKIEIYIDIVVPTELLEALPSKLLASEIGMRLGKSELRIKWRVLNSKQILQLSDYRWALLFQLYLHGIGSQNAEIFLKLNMERISNYFIFLIIVARGRNRLYQYLHIIFRHFDGAVLKAQSSCRLSQGVNN
jgi:hypothetical protein